MPRRSARLRRLHPEPASEETEYQLITESEVVTPGTPATSTQSLGDDGSGDLTSDDAGEPLDTTNRSSRPIITSIEEIFESTIAQAQQGSEMSIPYRSTRGSGTTRLNYPGRSIHEAKKFTAVFRILEMAHEALCSGKIITKRNIFYQYPHLFREQRVMDELVDDIALTLGIGRHALNISAAGKGLVAGSIRFLMGDGSTVKSDCTGTLIPLLDGLRQIDFGPTR